VCVCVRALPTVRYHDTKSHLCNASSATSGVMSEDTCRFYAAQMLLGLEALHKQSIIYRDMKPDNVLLDLRGDCRLSDFGVSVRVGPETDFTARGRAGTPGYQAPGTTLASGHMLSYVMLK